MTDKSKTVCATINCRIEKRSEERYMICASQDIITDILEKVSMWCSHPEKLFYNIDNIEIIAPKGKMRRRVRENDEEILDVEILK